MRKTLFAIALVAGCGSNALPTTGTDHLAVLGNDFTGNYVRVHGTRSVPADTKYPCLNEFDVCLGLDPAGATAAVQDLCPSDDTPAGTWTFTYVVYADSACATALDNLGCVPDVNEWLNPGHNNDDVTCITRNSDKSFDLCVMDPVTGAGSEACPSCTPVQDTSTCNPI